MLKPLGEQLALSFNYDRSRWFPADRVERMDNTLTMTKSSIEGAAKRNRLPSAGY